MAPQPVQVNIVESAVYKVWQENVLKSELIEENGEKWLQIKNPKNTSKHLKADLVTDLRIYKLEAIRE